MTFLERLQSLLIFKNAAFFVWDKVSCHCHGWLGIQCIAQPCCEASAFWMQGYGTDFLRVYFFFSFFLILQSLNVQNEIKCFAKSFWILSAVHAVQGNLHVLKRACRAPLTENNASTFPSQINWPQATERCIRVSLTSHNFKRGKLLSSKFVYFVMLIHWDIRANRCINRVLDISWVLNNALWLTNSRTDLDKPYCLGVHFALLRHQKGGCQGTGFSRSLICVSSGRTEIVACKCSSNTDIVNSIKRRGCIFCNHKITCLNTEKFNVQIDKKKKKNFSPKTPENLYWNLPFMNVFFYSVAPVYLFSIYKFICP